jgi:hypothetical protein
LIGVRIQLDNLISRWLSDRHLTKHYKVYKYDLWDHYNHEWPDILDDVESFVGMSCDGVGVALAIMDDHVYYKNTDSGPKIKIMAGDPEFFTKLEEDLIRFHNTIHKKGWLECDPDPF